MAESESYYLPNFLCFVVVAGRIASRHGVQIRTRLKSPTMQFCFIPLLIMTSFMELITEEAEK